MRAIGGCLSRFLLLALLLGALYAGWRWDPVVFPHVRSWLGMEGAPDRAEVDPSPELAAETVLRFESFLEAGGGGSLSLGGPEISSVLRYTLPGILPSGISEPRAGVSNGEVRIGALVARDALPRLPELEQLVRVLPDTVAVELGAVIMPFSGESSVLLVRRVEVAGIPVPRRFHPHVLEAVGREDRPGLPPEGMLIPLPRGLASMYVDGDSLILVSES